MSTWLIDALDLGVNEKGITRVLASLTPRLVAAATHILVVTSPAGVPLLPDVPRDRIVRSPLMLKSRWEQLGLPHVAKRLGATAVYSFREAGALWGPPLVLHVPEDPEVRWRRDPPRTMRARARRLYSRTFLGASMRHAAVIGACTPSVGQGLAQRYGVDPWRVTPLPLGVDLEHFTPSPSPRADAVFHLGSPDPRDRSDLVVDAWAAARAGGVAPPHLVIAGRLGLMRNLVESRARALDVPIELTGRLSDDDLADHLRNAAVVVQPSSDEGFGLQPLEAMASGAPLVVTATGAVLDVVGDAAVVARAEAESIGEGIVTCLADPAPWRQAGRLRAEGFSWRQAAFAVLDAMDVADRTTRAHSQRA